MKVDGGKQLTSSGYVPWYGMEMMNRRFEPDYLSNINYWMANAKDKIRKSKHEAGSDDWVTEI
jgi:hypothetical protein